MKSRSETVFISSALAFCVGVPITIFSIIYLAESVVYAVVFILILVIAMSLIAAVTYLFRERIIYSIFGAISTPLRDIADPLVESFENLSEGKKEKALSKASIFVRNAAGYFLWVQMRRWVFATIGALIIAFAGFIGSALLKKQNDLIARQNEFFQQQILAQRDNLKLQQDVANQVERAEAIRRIYGPEYDRTPRVKAEAVRSLILVERAHISQNRNTLPTKYINLHDAKLDSAWLDSADLRKISFRGSSLRKTNFNSTILDGSSFRHTQLERATFLYAKIYNVQFSFSLMRKTVFANTKLNSSLFSHVDLAYSDFSSADFSGVSFARSNLEHVNWKNAVNWRKIKSFQGSTIGGGRNMPKGFLDLALSLGAYNRVSTGEELKKLIKEAKVSEEAPE